MQNFQMDASAFSPLDPNQSKNVSAAAFLKNHRAPLDTDGSNFKELIRRFDNALKELGLTDKRMRPQCLAAFRLALANLQVNHDDNHIADLGHAISRILALKHLIGSPHE